MLPPADDRFPLKMGKKGDEYTGNKIMRKGPHLNAHSC